MTRVPIMLTRPARSRSGRGPATRLVATLALVALPAAGLAQQPKQQGTAADEQALGTEGYIRPTPELERMIAAPRGHNLTLSANELSPDGRWFVETQSEMPTLAQLGKPHEYLGGLQVDQRANRARQLTTRSASRLLLVDASTGATRTIETPAGASIASPVWSPDAARVAYLANFDGATNVYVADVATRRSRRLTTTPVLATLVTTVAWAGPSRVVTVLVPAGRGAEPVRPAIEAGPLVRVHDDTSKDYTRTYASLLRDPYERALLEYHATGQLATIDVRTGAVRRIGAPAMIDGVDAAPDGEHFLVSVMTKPFSYVVQYQSFGRKTQLWDGTGKTLATLVDRPLRETDGGDDGAPTARPQNDTARRALQWLSSGALAWLQQEPAPKRQSSDSGDARPSRRKDRLFEWAPPFADGAAKAVLESDNRIADLALTDDGRMAVVAENANGVAHVYAVSLDEPAKRYTISRGRGLAAALADGRGGFGPRTGSPDDSLTFYRDPGLVMVGRGRAGQRVALVSPDGKYAYLEGTQYYHAWPDSAPRPFVDRIEIRSGQKTRLFESAPDVYEQPIAPLDPELRRVVTSRESKTSVPDFWAREVGGDKLVQLTHNVDYAPEVTSAQRRRIAVQRADGHTLWVTVTLPAGWHEGTRLPAMFWFYPYEYTDQGAYDRSKRTENVNRFPATNPRSIEMLVTQGYAIVQPDAPVFGDQGRMNDNYVPDLRNNLAAVIDELDRQGLIDRQRLGLGGHSYGAFSTVNAMVHTPFFKAGIAGDGNYNRTLTPNGFQTERRDLWQGRDTYLSMSPILYADRLTGALLMYHSLEDQNVGTDPVNSIRLLHALEGMGKTAALYMYPYEDHGPIAKETVLDQWARWTAWLDKYVKGATATRVAGTH